MQKTEPPPRRGRKSKDEALVLRDQYWALFLKSKLPEESYASLESRLFPHLEIKRRQDSLGYSKPFALSKVAKGKRGLSPNIGEPPQAVLRAEALVPGATDAFTSILWSSLKQPATSINVADQCGSIALEVKRRFSARHFSSKPGFHAGLGHLNLQGIRRLSRLKHMDALGLLLSYCPTVNGVSQLSLLAEAYVLSLVQRCCKEDRVLGEIKSALIGLISERFRIRDKTSRAKSNRIFLAPRVSLFAVSLRSLMTISKPTARKCP